MKKYVILDEINLELVGDKRGAYLFDEQNEAINFASAWASCDGWRIVDIPFPPYDKEIKNKGKAFVELTEHYKELKPIFKNQLLEDYNIDCGHDYAKYIFNLLEVTY
jgi:hypothetical protein